MQKVWFITGASRGLGRSLTKTVLASGAKVAATARDIKALVGLTDEYPETLFPIPLDVTDYSRIDSVIQHVIEKFGRIDVLVNNAGFGITGAAEAYSDDQVRSQLETNLNAPIAITRAVLPVMRKQGSGRILQVSSIGGRVGNAGVTIYQAAKFGLSGFSEALAKEVNSLGIKVTAVEPGGFRTDWAGDSMTYAPQIDGYDIVKEREEFFRSGDFVPMGDPEKAAKVILELSEHQNPPIHLVLGSEAVSMLKHVDAVRAEELEKWLPVSISTDHDDAVNFFESELGKSYLTK
ncbi:MAG: SDR family NAD(P)-dependent oxidoreductase [Flavobacterium sp.]|uniref:SDR family NAD(P)-dependent oxidoreductase n=1 Tax=Flavobacterium sp. TaxID=239 RepID=UPI0012219920|nr:SDR family NAD(P)-dependent oxidoreductase [Flavobacterium sp.]RZJ64189.1 MAG: SDR family NAD(P)-dependent oxidoreductase [Flavobacterium sp.]